MNETESRHDGDQRVWEQGWRDHEERQLERLARLSLSDKLAWLEEAHRLVLYMRENADSRPHP